MPLIRKTQLIRALVTSVVIGGFSAVAVALMDNPDLGNVETSPVNVRFKDASDEEPDFQKHVAPLLGRLGCNGRSCHGSFQGQGGFRLSLFGYDFEADHQALMEPGAARVDLGDPLESLVLTKPTSDDDHEGGLRYEKDKWQYNLLKSWITSGGLKPETIHKLDRLAVEPAELLLSNSAEQVELRATAYWADGTVEDVTPLCRFSSNDESIAVITENGLVSTDSIAGDTHVVVSYDNAVVPVPVIHPNSPGVYNAESISTPTPIDQLVANKWRKLGIQPSNLSDDDMFLRRVSIDITGTLPTPDEIREFISSSDPGKRANKIDELLQSPAYAAWWTTFFCDMTENNSTQLRNISYDNNAASQQWYDWIYQRVEENVPYDEMIEGIVLGVSREDGESYADYCERMTQAATDFPESATMPYYWMRREFRDPEPRAISFAHAFLGLRIQCAQCHKHPFDQWSQNDFKEFSRFFGGVSAQAYNQGKTPEDRQDYAQILKDLSIDPKSKNNGETRKKLAQALRQGKTTPFGFLTIHEPRPSREELNQFNQEFKEARKQNKQAKYRRPKITQATLLGGEVVELGDHLDIRVPVMEWMRRADNPFFAKAIVNRVWAVYFGVGIVDPADDLNLANPPSNAELLDYLASSFIEHDFDMKWLHREIANSRTYQLSWVPNETNQNDRRNFSRALPRRLPAEVVFDAIAFAASNTKANRLYRESVVDRAISIPGTIEYRNNKNRGTNSAFALKVFGRSERTSSCDCDRSEETSLIQTVYMQNDRDIHTMLTQKNSWINQMAVRHQNDPAVEEYRAQADRLRNRIASLQKTKSKQNEERQTRRVDRQIKVMESKLQPLVAKLESAESDKTTMDVQAVITEAYLRTLSRFPTEEEIARCESHIREDKDLINGVTGVLWALVNTKEFIVNH